MADPSKHDDLGGQGPVGSGERDRDLDRDKDPNRDRNINRDTPSSGGLGGGQTGDQGRGSPSGQSSGLGESSTRSSGIGGDVSDVEEVDDDSDLDKDKSSR